MAISTYKVFLMRGTGSGTLSYSKLVDIKDFPDLGGSPDNLQTTTLSDKAHTYIPGIDNVEALEFTANYTASDYAALKALEGSNEHLAVWFGGSENNGVATPVGYDGIFTFDGYITVHVSGAGVNEVVDMVISIAPSTVIANRLHQMDPNAIYSVAGPTTSNSTCIVINTPAPTGTKWVYKLGTSNVTPTEGTAVASTTDWVSSTTSISASSNTKAYVSLVFSSTGIPIEYTNITLVKHA